MRNVTIKIEQFKPNRKLIEEMIWNDWDRSTAQMIENVDNYIKREMNVIRHKFPEATEIRWEFVGVDQGHYITVPTKPMKVKVMQLTREQLNDVMHRAIELEDWVMLERVAYQRRMMNEFMPKSPAFFELAYSVYDFEWMYVADAIYQPEDLNLD